MHCYVEFNLLTKISTLTSVRIKTDLLKVIAFYNFLILI